MDTLTLYIAGYFVISVTAMLLLERAHVRVQRALTRAHDESVGTLLITLDKLTKVNSILEERVQQLAQNDLSAYDEIEVSR